MPIDYLKERLLEPAFAAAYREALVQVRAEIASEQAGRVPELHPECDDIGSCEEQCSNYQACQESRSA